MDEIASVAREKDIFVFDAISKAIGDTVITATSTNTPTAVKIIVAIVKANKAPFSPITL